MPRKLTGIIAELREKITGLVAQRDRAVQESERLREEVDTLRRQLSDTSRQLELARQEVDFLTVSHRLADSPDKLVAARRRVQRLIAKIDRCVSLLREDADIS
ncbi:MAG: hypothetical protein J5995_03295 [Muribaculaceae bacterium]|nr:hypothetical protein [Muribaculaceae bacterium]